MDNNYTHISMVIDRSGSMETCWNDVKGGYAEIVKQNKEAEGKCTFTVAVFDDSYELVEDFTDIQNVSEDLKVAPRGWTALLDAIGKTINSVGATLSNMKESDRPSKVMMLIQTDGMENSSSEFSKDMITKMIADQTEKYNWVFQFIGADITAVNEAKSWGISGANSSVYSTNNSLDTFTLLGSKMRSARSAVDNNAYMVSVSFSEEDREILNEEKVSTKTK